MSATKPSSTRRALRTLVLLAVAAGLVPACDSAGDSDGEDGFEFTPSEAVFEEQPPIERVRADGVCAWRFHVITDETSYAAGTIWTYEAERPVRMRYGSHGIERYEQTWSYDAQGRLVRFERRDQNNDGTNPPQIVETWGWDGEHLVTYEKDIGADDRIDHVWRWTWDAQGRLLTREASLDGVEGFEYREDTSWPEADLERTVFDLDGDGDEDLRLDRRFDAGGNVVEAWRTGAFGGALERYERRELGTRRTIWTGPDNTALTDAIQPLGATSRPDGIITRVHGGDHEYCDLDASGRVVRYAVDEDGIDPPELLIQADEQTGSLRYDVRGNAIAPATTAFYDEGFEGFRCGDNVPDTAGAFPQPVPLTEAAYGIDPLCEPEYLACRALAPWRVVRCPQY